MKLNINLKSKILLQLLLNGITPLLVIGTIAFILASRSLEEGAVKQLESVTEIKTSAVERYFKSIENQILTFSENQMIIDAAKDFKKSFDRIADN